ncbi:RND family efflux transporter MFP subunit [Dyadobacter sp. BE34]|uniref:RND family efflux transporter MFP subunit n=1 Tax=Dyadobacter fermentans TaxID=94254 RepID=A0ABU1R8M6_9BACT|nr:MULTISPECIES: efflux RND transporter periplasmic adaptor subunit [Dyadobacter]MDR6809768.1 RND family efflux transporter MFP subunit [Dyadobacter fermentans]MDR7047517.1 RND family efflux transporter MFP subunit [Dyadobacter sp. BE242]MDR7201687.1 RND family efflux transporter MFP subunit [Dyadobacter sp. BE34]MDR7219557.1 RND family efflux transporter MFP subunit [Dyadobacter sp. BE31]MDR7267320.1 RND family efflux transporter MFP subunit [Dyadobacter sp. BE32]
MKKILIITSLLISLYFLASCKNEKTGEQKQEGQTEQAAEEGEHEEHENPSTANLTAEQIKSIGVEMGSIEEKELTAALKANGTLKVPNQNRATVNTLYSGVIQTLKIQPGDKVRKGQVIATLANPDFMRFQEEYVAVSDRIALAELEFNRQKELSAGNAGALKNFQTANTDLKTLQTRRNTLAQQIRLMGIEPSQLSSGKLVSVLSVKSPISGVVSSVSAQIGSYVDLTSPIAEIVDNSQLHLDLFVYEKDLSKLRENQTIHFTLTNAPGQEYDAQIFSLGSSFEGESKAVSVHAKVMGNKSGLIDGMNITAAISLEKAKVPAVPTDAVVNYQGQDYIFIVTDPHTEDEHHKESSKDAASSHQEAEPHDHKAGESGEKEPGVTFEKVPVAKGTSDVGYTEITLLKPIPQNAKIVVKGAFFVLAKMTNAGGEHEH